MAEDDSVSRRVKLYQLNDAGQWDDKGTGHVQHSTADDGDGEFIILTVMCEETSEVLLEHRIEPRIDYQRQGETIITWCDDSSGTDLALSFQEKPHCDDVWQQIEHHQEQSRSRNANEDGGSFEEEYGDEGDLPFPDLTNLREISTRINQVSPMKKDIAIACLQQEGYLEKLFSLFQAVEDLDEVEDAFVIFSIFKGMFMLNDIGLFDVILNDDNIMKVIAALEYDPGVPKEMTEEYQKHRNFLKRAQFKQVVDFNSAELSSKVHQNYRIAYIKDVILLRYLDDATMNTLNSLLFFNNVGIVSKMIERDVLKDFFAELHKQAAFDPSKVTSLGSRNKSKKEKEEEAAERTRLRKNLFLFLQELCGLAKPLQSSIRDDFYKKLSELGVFRAIEEALAVSTPEKTGVAWLWLSCADILSNILNHDPSLLRAYLLTKKAFPDSLLGCLVSSMVSPHVGCGLSDQLAQILRTVLDPDTMLPGDKDAFLDHFYEKHAMKLVNAVVASKDVHQTVYTNDASEYQACELLSYCVQQHGYRSKQLIMKNDTLSKVGALLLEKRKPNVVCSAIRFIRNCIGMKDEMISRQLVQKKILDTLMDVFMANGARYNLLNSSVVEMINFVRQENMKALVHYFVINHQSKFKHVQYVKTFEELKKRWEQNQEYMKNSRGARGGDSNGDTVGMDSDASEYAYFNENDDSEEDQSSDTKSEIAKDQEANANFLKATEAYRQNQKRKLDDDIDLISMVKKNKTHDSDSKPAIKFKLGGKS